MLNRITRLKVRDVYLATDSDVYTNDAVRESWRMLGAFLESEFGAKVRFVCPPPGRGGKKVGVDDFFASGGTLEQLLAYYRTSLPEPPRVASAPWPTDERDAFYGLAGEVIRAIAPHTEADPFGLLACYLTEFGAFVGQGPYIPVGASRHPARLFIVMVGRSAYSRKGTAQSEIDRVYLEAMGQARFNRHVEHGLSSGEGLILAFENLEPANRRLLFVFLRYSEASAAYIFGTMTGDSIADRILAELRLTGSLTLSHIGDLFGWNQKSPRLRAAIDLLGRMRLVRTRKVKGKGRPAVWIDLASR